MENLRKEVEKLKEKYLELMSEINLKKANGNLGQLFSLNEEFDETFDLFFDQVELRKKYKDYNYELEIISFEKTNEELLKELDEEDLKLYIDFFMKYIKELEEKLEEL